MTAPETPSIQPQVSSAALPEVAPRSAGALVWLALLLAVAALLLVGWQAWVGMQTAAPVPAMAPPSFQLPDSLQRRLEQQEANLNTLRREQDTWQAVMQAELEALAAVPLQLAQLQQQWADISGMEADQRAALLRAEALHYLQLANAQAALAGNAGIAARALRLADERLRVAADPALLPVRAAISTELAAIEALPDVDTVGIALRLQALAGQVAAWPLRNRAPDSFKGDPAAAANELQGWERVKATAAAAFAGIVRVRSTTEPRVTQLAAADEALVIEGVRAEFRLARLAWVGRDAQLFAASVAALQALIPEYFDTDAPGPRAALATLEEFAGIELPATLPDVSTSLSLLQKAAGRNGDSLQ